MERHVEIGLIKVKHISEEGYPLGLCKVMEGEKEVYAALQKGKLYVKPTEKKKGIDKLIQKAYGN